MYFSGAGGGPDFIDVERDEIAAEFKKAAAGFRSAAAKANLEAEWRSALEFPNLVVGRAAAAADLVVAGRSPGKSRPDAFRSVALGDLLMGLGRPLLLAPAGMGEVRGRNVLVGWKDSPEARRGAFRCAALPQAGGTGRPRRDRRGRRLAPRRQGLPRSP